MNVLFSILNMFLFLVRVFFSLGLRFFDDGRGRTPIKYELVDESKSNMDLIYTLKCKKCWYLKEFLDAVNQ